MDNLDNIVKSFLDKYSINGRVLCALSGGCDSVVMTHLLQTSRLEVIAIHLNHNWRGEESKRDEEFSRNFSKKLGIEFYSEKLSSDIKKTETKARSARYDFFEHCAKKFNTPFVFLAHNKDDNAQTLLYRAIKGTGLRGLRSIPEKRGIYYRPLLSISRADIEAYAKENNLQYVIDSSNYDTKYKRNYIRKEIIPKLEHINPNVINALCSLSDLSKLQYTIVENALNMLKQKIYKGNKIILDEFLKLDSPMQFEIMNDFLSDDLKYIDFKRIKSYVDFVIEGGGKKSLNSALFLTVEDGYIQKSSCHHKKNASQVFVKGEGIYEFSGKKIEIRRVFNVENFAAQDGVRFLNLDFNNEICIRTRREGDTFCPFGMKSGKMKLQDYLINKKIARNKRENLILLAQNKEILCILNLQISEKCRADSKSCYAIKVWE